MYTIVDHFPGYIHLSAKQKVISSTFIVQPLERLYSM